MSLVIRSRESTPPSTPPNNAAFPPLQARVMTASAAPMLPADSMKLFHYAQCDAQPRTIEFNFLTTCCNRLAHFQLFRQRLVRNVIAIVVQRSCHVTLCCNLEADPVADFQTAIPAQALNPAHHFARNAFEPEL